MNVIFDPVRKKWVEKTKEEEIRQKLIKKMVEELGYPLSHIAIEKELAQLPHLQCTDLKKIPKRRLDILVFAKNIHPDHSLFPVLMIECKAVKITPKVAEQVIGYNSLVKAPFLAIANETEILTGFFDVSAGIFKFEPGLPTYEAVALGRMTAV